MALIYLRAMPPSTAASLLERTSIRDSYGLEATVTVSLGDSGVVLDQASLLDAMRRLSSDGAPQELLDQEGRAFTLDYVQDAPSPAVQLSSDKGIMTLESLLVCSSRREDRLAEFARRQRRSLLPKAVAESWRQTLEKDALSEAAFHDFKDAFDASPGERALRLRREMMSGSCTPESLAPPTPAYWRNLAGIEGKPTASAFIEERKRREKELFPSDDRREQLKLLLLAAPHSALAPSLSALGISEEELRDVFKWLAEFGDPLSCVSIIEATIPQLDRFQALAPDIRDLYERILPKGVASRRQRMRLLSAAAILVEGELARRRTLSEDQPYYRRIMGLAQAGLIERVAREIGVDLDRFADYAAQHGRLYVAQCLVDRRLEPFWNPDFLLPDQLSREAAARIHNCAAGHFDAVKAANLDGVLLVGAESEWSETDIMQMGYAGALEGAREHPIKLPATMRARVVEGLKPGPGDIANYIPLANCAGLFSIPQDVQELAVERLRNERNPVRVGGKPDAVGALLYSLATTAATTRNAALTDEVFRHIRWHVALYPDDLDLMQTLCAGVTACAAYSALDDWRRAVGEFFRDLSFRVEKQSDARAISGLISALESVDPELCVHCGKAKAVLAAVWQATPTGMQKDVR